MSYNIYLVVKSGFDKEVEAFETNMTSNVAPMWRKAGCDIADFDGEPAISLAVSLHAAIRHMEDPFEQAEYRDLNPENGWGDYDTCLKFLRKLLDACLTHNLATVRVSR